MIALASPHHVLDHKMRDTESDIVQDYDDGAGWPNATRAKELVFRQGFVEEARRVVRQWAHPIEDPPELPESPESVVPLKLEPVTLRQLLDEQRFDSTKEIKAAQLLRERVRERYTVYAPGYGPLAAGRKTYHLGYRRGHEIPAARLRGRHHALVYVLEPWEHLETADIDIFDPKLLCPWLKMVEEWAETPLRPKAPKPPPRVLELAKAMEQEAEASIPSYFIPPPPNPPQITAASPLLPGVAQVGKIGSSNGSSSRMPSETTAAQTILAEVGKNDSSSDSPPDVPATSTVNPFGIRVDAVCLADVEPEPIHWLWPGRFALGKLSLIAGEPGLGKSFLTLDMAARVSRGDGWPCEPTSGAGGATNRRRVQM